MQLEQAKQRFEQDPTNPRNRLYLAQAQQAMASASAANRAQYQVVGTNANGNAVVVDMRDPSRTRVLEGVRPTRSELAEGAAYRHASNNQIRRHKLLFKNAVRSGQVREQARQDKIVFTATLSNALCNLWKVQPLLQADRVLKVLRLQLRALPAEP